MTLVDRKTRFLVGKKLDDHRAETLKESTCNSLKALPCHTLTVDNGKEFAAHKAITAESNAQVYFAHRIVHGKGLPMKTRMGCYASSFPSTEAFQR
jgi:IS30 family transposase